MLFLGAAGFQVPPIEYARRRGYFVITCDNRPENPGHQLANRRYDISSVDCGAVLEMACAECVDGVLAFGSDVSALTAAHVAERLGLPGAPPSVVESMTRKDLFRGLLREKGVQSRTFRTFHVSQRDQIGSFVAAHGEPMLIKPADSSGGKGVARLSGDGLHPSAVDRAYAASRLGLVIVEEIVSRRGAQICGDGFVENGELVFADFGDGHFFDDGMTFAPFAETFPTRHGPDVVSAVTSALNRALRACGFERGSINFDVLVAEDGRPFVVEIGPRPGGNLLPVAISILTGVDLVGAAVEACIDPAFRLSVPERRRGGFVASYMLHTRASGRFLSVLLPPAVRSKVVRETLFVEPGAEINTFRQGSDAIGNLLLDFRSASEMAAVMQVLLETPAVRLQPSRSRAAAG